MNAIYLYKQYRDVFAELDPEDCKTLLLAMMDYGLEEAAVEMPKHLRPLWILIKAQIENDRDAYNERCERNRKNGSKGGRPKMVEGPAATSLEPAATSLEPEDKKETDALILEEIPFETVSAEKPKRKLFKPPTEDECKEYFAQKCVFDESEALRFYTHYEANGWMVGKNKMKKWRQAASNWILNEQKYIRNGTYRKDTREEARRAIYDIFNGG